MWALSGGTENAAGEGAGQCCQAEQVCTVLKAGRQEGRQAVRLHQCRHKGRDARGGEKNWGKIVTECRAFLSGGMNIWTAIKLHQKDCRAAARPRVATASAVQLPGSNRNLAGDAIWQATVELEWWLRRLVFAPPQQRVPRQPISADLKVECAQPQAPAHGAPLQAAHAATSAELRDQPISKLSVRSSSTSSRS